jgi:predicted MFS family arabinose efflux permease
MALGLSAVAPTVPLAFVALALLGAAGSAFNISAQSRLQLSVEDQMTSRVMALYSVGFTGAKPIGGLLTGIVLDAAGARAAFALGAVVLALSTGLYAWSRNRRISRSSIRPRPAG